MKLSSLSRILASIAFLLLSAPLLHAKDVTSPQFKPNPPGIRELSSLNASDGFVVKGFEFNDQLGIYVTAIGDINGDSIDDFATVANNAGNTNIASAYVVFGSTSGFPLQLDADDLNGTNGFAIHAAAAVPPALRDEFTGISGTGDINGDGFDDLLLGMGNNQSQSGQVYVIYGSNQPFAASLQTSAINGSNGFVVEGAAQFALLGEAVGGGGDFNKDGKPDMLLGMRSTGTYVVFGRTGNFAHPFDVANLDGSNGFLINANASDGAGISVANVGDINGDTIDDIGIGASQGKPDGVTKTGAGYVVFGSTSAFAATFELSSLTGSNGFKITGDTQFGATGTHISAAGDFNRDGIADLIIGSPNSKTNGVTVGRADVIYGSSTTFAASIALAEQTLASGFIFRGTQSGDNVGSSVSPAGDVNGDGISDILIGAGGASQFVNGFQGRVYLVYGASSGLPAMMDQNDINGNNGLSFLASTNGDTVGTDISGGVDLNKDGFSDIIMGGRGVDPSEFGATYVVFGKQASGVPSNVFASLLPAARSGYVGGPDISVFASVINGGSNPASNCSITTPDFSPASIRFYETNPTTNAITGSQNEIFNLAANQTRSFVLFFTPSLVRKSGQEVFPVIACDNAFVTKIPGVNGEFLTIDSVAGPDILTIAVTGSSDGIIRLPSPSEAGFMAISALNIGLGDGLTAAKEVSVTANIRTTFPALPLNILICETNAAGVCMADPAQTLDLVIGDTAKFIGVFAFGQGTAIALDPAKTRVTVDLKNSSNQILSSTSVAVMTE